MFGDREILHIVRHESYYVATGGHRPPSLEHYGREARYICALREELKSAEREAAKNPRRQDLRVRAVAIRRELKKLEGDNRR
jgi:hypothetical protein